MSNKLRWIVVFTTLAVFIAVVFLRFAHRPAPEPSPNPVQPVPPVEVREPQPQPEHEAAEPNPEPQESSTLSGRVVHAETNTAVPDVSIDFRPVGRRGDTITAQSDAEGFFFVADIPVGTYFARMQEEALAITPDSMTVQVAKEPATEVTLMVTAGLHISGRVYDRDTGAGIAGVRMNVQSKDFEVGISAQKTNDAGEYTFPRLVPGSYRISRDFAPGYGLQEESVNVHLVTGRNQDAIDFGLSKGLRIAGRVFDEDNNPVEGVEIYGAGMERRSGAKTAADGSFVLGGFAANDEVTVLPMLRGQAILEMDPPKGVILMKDADVTGVRIVLGVAATISGTVVDARGAPKAGVRVRARGAESSSVYGDTSSESKEDGALLLSGLRAGEYELVFVDLPGNRPDHPIQKISLAKSEHITGLRFTYPLTGGLTITGRVTNSRGAPLEKAAVFVQGEDPVHTDADGRYVVPDLTADEYQLVAAHHQYSNTDERAVAAGAANVNFVLKDRASIQGQVVSARTGKPISVFSMGGGPVHDPDGRFELDVDEGETTIRFRAEGYVEQQVKLPLVAAGETKAGIVVRLESGNTIAGRVVDASGSAISGVEIFRGDLSSISMYDIAPLTTRADGSFKMDGVPAGQTQISARHPKFVAKTVDVNVVPGSTNRVDIVLPSGGGIEGRVTLDRKPLANQQVAAMFAGDDKIVQTDAEGRYVFSGLPDGSVTVSASLQNGNASRNKSSETTVANGFVTELNFEFVLATGSIEGTVFEAPGQPLTEPAHIGVQVNTGGGVWENTGAQTNSAGQFVLEGIPPGNVLLHLAIRGRPPKIEHFSIGDGQRLNRDILLYGGATVRVRVRTEWPCEVYAAQGNPDIKPMTREKYSSLQRMVAAAAGMVGGEAELIGLEPGTYTIVVLGHDQPNLPPDADPFAHVLVTSTVVQLSKDEEKSVQLEF